MSSNIISDSVIKRLPRYYRFLGELKAAGLTRISSRELSERMGLTASQIRQDLNCFGGFGQQGYGYHIEQLRNEIGNIYITCTVFENGVIRITIRDKGCGIENVKQAMEPLYTSLGGDRSGLGFSVMESFSDKLKVRSKVGVGTTVTIEKKIMGKVK